MPLFTHQNAMLRRELALETIFVLQCQEVKTHSHLNLLHDLMSHILGKRAEAETFQIIDTSERSVGGPAHLQERGGGCPGEENEVADISDAGSSFPCLDHNLTAYLCINTTSQTSSVGGAIPIGSAYKSMRWRILNVYKTGNPLTRGTVGSGQFHSQSPHPNNSQVHLPGCSIDRLERQRILIDWQS